jgi:hypothetical protein
MESQKDLRENDAQDSCPTNADDRVAPSATSASPNEPEASPVAERGASDEAGWICIWPPNPETIRKFRLAARTSSDT